MELGAGGTESNGIVRNDIYVYVGFHKGSSEGSRSTGKE